MLLSIYPVKEPSVTFRPKKTEEGEKRTLSLNPSQGHIIPLGGVSRFYFNFCLTAQDKERKAFLRSFIN